jgi:hypothetical protein
MTQRPFLPRTQFSRRLEPQGNTVLHGAGQSPDAFRHYYDAIGTSKPALFMTYVDLREDLASYFQTLAHDLDQYAPVRLIPQLGLMMTGSADAAHHPEQHYEDAVAAGDYDAQIGALCEGLRQLGRPVFLRIGFEFNGPWFGYAPVPYVAAWRRIVSALRQHDLHDVATVWCYYPLPWQVAGQPDYWAYYPGDDYVDWWAIDLFSAAEFTAEPTLAFLADAERHRYPVMIGESTPRWVGGVQGGAATWDAWFAPYFAFIRAHPVIKAFCYINWDWTTYPVWQDWGDARIEVNPVILERYQRELADPIYRHAVEGVE